jgi:predicted dehydrogenase
MTKKIGVGLYGTRAHQIHEELVNHPHAQLVAVAAFDKSLPGPLKEDKSIARYDTLEQLVADERVELVSLCSPVRRKQAKEAIFCMKAGKHVYAEKPCAMTEEELNEIVEVSRATGKHFHEMAGTAFEQPYLTMRKIVQDGIIGTVVQVFAQKSYPYTDRRPQDEDVDGGLLMQVGVHAFRYVEHVACQKIIDVYALETQLGNPKPGNLRMASAVLMKLENGGIASVIANYLNQPGFGSWGNEHLRIFGTKGFVESVDAGSRTRLVVGDKDMGPLTISHSDKKTYFDMYIDSLLGKAPMPFSLEDELHPTLMIIRAKQRAELVKAR